MSQELKHMLHRARSPSPVSRTVDHISLMERDISSTDGNSYDPNVESTNGSSEESTCIGRPQSQQDVPSPSRTSSRSPTPVDTNDKLADVSVPSVTIRLVSDANIKEAATPHTGPKLVEHTSGTPHIIPYWIGIWWWESICCIIVVLAFISLVVTLKIYDGRATPDFPRGITFNTVISIYAVIIKATAGLVAAEGLSHLKWAWFTNPQLLYDLETYDDASRGPWGAARLIYRLKFRNAISSMGAAITLMLLVLDPFTQQIIRQFACTRPSNTMEAYIHRTQYLNGDGMPQKSPLNLPQYGTLGYLYKAILGGSLDRELVSCPSGNCTFDEFSTLALESTCTDVSYEIVWRRTDDPYSLMLNESYSLVLNESIGNYIIPIYPPLDPPGPDENVQLVRNVWSKQNSVVAADGAHLTWIFWSNGPSAYRCSMRPCIETLKAEVKENQLMETLLSRYTVPLDAGLSVVDLWSLEDPESQKSGLRTLGYKFDNSSRFIAYDLRWASENGGIGDYLRCPDHLIPLAHGEDPDSSDDFCYRWYMEFNNGTRAPRYSLTYKASDLVPMRSRYIAHIPQNLLEPFTGSSIEAVTSEQEEFGAKNIPYLALQETAGKLSAVEALMANVTRAMSIYMRVHGSANLSVPARGTPMRETSCVSIAWPWVTYSASTVLLVLFFFISMIWRSRRAQRALQKEWGVDNCSFDFKSSALQLLFHGLDRETLEQHSSGLAPNKSKELKKTAQKTTVKLFPYEDGLKLSSKMD
ncbi:hypothetical protein E8E13_004653 [Curvularia kusanoi]|uniref:Uncharacterized protein n=1 Tax=Curvularia kusanoi TaxID=90978 RepID=A0A9P4T7R8_CURKU|nr:hypothetical protein E8E13_004653 [Curvularia kusanoi]